MGWPFLWVLQTPSGGRVSGPTGQGPRNAGAAPLDATDGHAARTHAYPWRSPSRSLLAALRGAKVFVPIVGARPRSRKTGSGFLRDGQNTPGIHLALPIVVGRGHQQDVGASGQDADCLLRRRSPSASRTDVERVITQFFERSKAHGVDRRFGHADACAIGSTEAKQLLGAAGRKAAPARAALFPAGDGVAGICVRRPHAAMRTLPKPAMGNNTGDDAIGDVPFVGQITPGRGAGPRSKAMLPTDRDGGNRLRPGRTLPDRGARAEADDT